MLIFKPFLWLFEQTCECDDLKKIYTTLQYTKYNLSSYYTLHASATILKKYKFTIY